MKNNKPNYIVVEDIDDRRVLTYADLEKFREFCNIENEHWIEHRQKEVQRIMDLNKKAAN